MSSKQASKQKYCLLYTSDDKPAGKIATRIVNDTETLRTQFYNSCMILVIYLVRFLFILGILFYLSPMMGLLLCLVFPIFYGIQYLYKVCLLYTSIGGGNLWRGEPAAEAGMDRVQADYTGMLGTVMNALVMADSLQQVGVDTRVPVSYTHLTEW